MFNLYRFCLILLVFVVAGCSDSSDPIQALRPQLPKEVKIEEAVDFPQTLQGLKPLRLLAARTSDFAFYLEYYENPTLPDVEAPAPLDGDGVLLTPKGTRHLTRKFVERGEEITETWIFARQDKVLILGCLRGKLPDWTSLLPML